ncbi:hypothetical protein CRG98_030852, partial [Punica granatum]
GAPGRASSSTRPDHGPRPGDSQPERYVGPSTGKGARSPPFLGLAGALVFALARTYAAFSRLPSAKGCQLIPSIPTLIFESSSAGIAGPTSAGSTGWCSTIATSQTIPVLAGSAFPHLPTTSRKRQNRNGSTRPQFVPTIQDRSKQCEYHRGVPRHTLDNCWKLRERIQEMIDSKELMFNAGSSINMISICALGEGESEQDSPAPFVIEYVPAETTVGFAGIGTSPTPFVIDIPARELYSDDKVPWTYEGGVGNLEQQFSVMGVTRSGRVYENSATTDKGKAPAIEIEAIPGIPPTPPKKVAEEEAKAFMKIIKASEYKIVEQMAKSPAHISLLALLLSSEPHREALLRVLTATQVPKGTPLDRIEETVSSIFSNTILFSDDELPSEGCEYSRALHIVCKCNNYVIGRVMIDNGFALNVCPVTTLKQMNVDLNRVRPSKTAVRAFDGSRRELKFIVEEKLITVKGEEDYAIYKETAVLYISVGNDENLPFHSFETISVIREYRKDRQLTSVEPTEEINVGTEDEPRTLKIGTGLNPTQRTRMIDFLTRYQEVFAWSYADMPEEVVKQINACFHEVCNYSEWVANIVPVEKNDGRVRVCVDYRDLNKASPKDNFPLPHIDVLVDNTVRHTQFSFMDGFSGYNQIRMAEEDKIKTTFSTMWGTFYYQVMPFGLKNAGATYQRAMCTFGARSRKLLGFVVSERGIEVDPDKVKAIRELPPPSSVREVRGFLGRLNYIARFIANLTDKCQPLFRLLSKNVAIEWDEECPKAFNAIKAYLVQPPVLVPPTPDRPLILYLTADPLKYLLDSPSSMRNIAKWRCQLMEYDIEYVSRPSVKGQPIADHLAEFPIEDNTPIIPNFPDEGILQVDGEDDKPEWKMYFDGAVNSTGSGIGAILISPDGCYYPVAAKIDFPCTNNVAEYEACILGLQAAIDFKVKELEVFDDSMLTIFQTLRQWKTKDAKLVPYHEYLERLTENFEDISFTYTPRLINPKASNGHLYILVAIDYFTKWIEAITLASVIAKAVARFFKRDLIARCGVPATIITDNTKNLNNK